MTLPQVPASSPWSTPAPRMLRERRAMQRAWLQQWAADVNVARSVRCGRSAALANRSFTRTAERVLRQRVMPGASSGRWVSP